MHRTALPAILLLLAGLVFTAQADPPNTAILDGRPTEYDGADLAGSFAGAAAWGPTDVITNLYVTWDATYLYVALQAWESGNKFAVLLDADPGAGTGATTTTNWSGVTPDFIRYNDVGWQASAEAGAESFGLDYMIASEGFYNNIVRLTYDGLATPDSNTVEALFDVGNGASPRATPVDMVVQADGTECTLKGFEARIPWSVLYATNRHGEVHVGEVVPQGAKIRLFANLHNNDPAIAYSAPDAIPAQTNAAAGGGWAAGLLTTANYVTYDVDADNDGFPDVAAGDVNAPFIRSVAGAQSNAVVYARFNEDVTEETATNPANWEVGGGIPESVDKLTENAFLLHLTNDLPAAGVLVPVRSFNIEDAATNSKTASLCLFPSDSGIATAVTVRFVLQTASGFGRTNALAYHLNGSTEPLEWGYPPATSMPLTLIGGPLTSYYCDVTFPPGTASRIYYKYSGILKNTGTNNFEAIRLQKYADASRWLTLPTDGSSLVVTDYLGAAAHPWRDPNDTNVDHYALLYNDLRRGDAGVRERVTMTFRLDLSGRDLYGVQRVLVVGSDPLRGFNTDGSGTGDWPGNPVYVDWLLGGLDLFDDGSHGDAVSGDGIYSREWSFSTNGVDATMEPFSPYSLVGGNAGSTLPYYGAWANRRTPRSFAYKYAVVFSAESALLDPSSDVEYYVETSDTNIVLDPYVWANSALPFAPAANPPEPYALVPVAGGTRILFTNALGEAQHGVQFSTNLTAGWLDYGQTAAGSGGNWTVTVQNASNPMFFRLYAGAYPFQGVWWEPNPLPETGGTMRIYYTQYTRGLAGDSNVQIAGNFPPSSWGPVPMTFIGAGTWYYDLVVDTNTFANPNIEFKPRNLSGTTWEGFGGGGDNYRAYRGYLRATWSPSSPTNEELFTITYDQAGGPLAAATNINAHVGFDEPWTVIGDGTRTMTNIGGTVWQLAFPVPTNASLSVNWVFNNGTLWDSEGGAGRQWRAFINQ